jgi:hypothetical protein
MMPSVAILLGVPVSLDYRLASFGLRCLMRSSSVNDSDIGSYTIRECPFVPRLLLLGGF